MTLWPWVGVVLLKDVGDQRFKKGFMALTAGYALFSVAANLSQQLKIQPVYSWSNDPRWVDCIDSVVTKTAVKGPPKVWQPHIPDILVELSSRHPEWDLTRTMDFESEKDKARKFTQVADVIVMSRFFNLEGDFNSWNYQGPERQQDMELVSQEIDQPFGPLILSQGGQWNRQICRVGPFFANIAVRRNP